MYDKYPKEHIESMEEEVAMGSPVASLACLPQAKAYLQSHFLNLRHRKDRFLQLCDFLKSHTCQGRRGSNHTLGA